MSSRPECPDCGERSCWGKSDGSGCGATSATPRVPKFYLCFLDFETTGLDPTRHEPIEVAAVVTDDRLNELGRFESLIVPEQVSWWTWDKPALEMHHQSGLLDLCLERGPALEFVGDELFTFLASTVPASAQIHLAGNSVHFDRSFLRAYFPEIERRFHHRHLDVSSVRIAAEVFAPDAPGLSGEKPHRAMADVLRSIQELRHWRRALREP
jgi:oligoribonuclease